MTSDIITKGVLLIDAQLLDTNVTATFSNLNNL